MPENDDTVEVPETLIYGPGAVNEDGTPKTMQATEKTQAEVVGEFVSDLNPIDRLKYYINLYAVFWVATTVLAVGILFIFGKPIMDAVIGSKAGKVGGVVKAVAS